MEGSTTRRRFPQMRRRAGPVCVDACPALNCPNQPGGDKDEPGTPVRERETHVAAVKEACRQQPQMVFTVRHATVTFQTDSEAWREQKEKRAALMVGILIGVFVLCWIPFFLTELITPLCSCHIPPIWKSVFLWLGYSNSFFNPLIYTAFNKNYNNAFRNLFSQQH